MSACSTATSPAFWAGLGSIVVAIGTLISSLRTGRKAEATGEKVDAHRTESRTRKAAFDAVIKQLEPRVRNGDAGHQ